MAFPDSMFHNNVVSCGLVGFVIKGEVGRIPVAGFLLRRIGSEFVERFEASGRARAARRASWH